MMNENPNALPIPRTFSVKPAVECCEILAELDNGGTYRRHHPDIRGPVAYWISNVLNSKLNEIVNPPLARVVRLENGTVHGPGIITLPGDIIVAESLMNCARETHVAGLKRLDDGKTYVTEPGFSEGRKMPPGLYVSLKQIWDGNYGHWLIEGLPRVKLLHDIIDCSKAKFIVSSQRPAMHHVFLDSLSAFGINREQIIVWGGESIQVEQLVYPLPLTVQPWVKAPIVVRTLETLATNMLLSNNKEERNLQIFVDRPDSSRRKLANKDEVLECAVQRGFTVVKPAEMTFVEQVRAFANAKYVIGVLGAELSNIVFSPSHCRMLGLASSYMQDDFFYDLISHKAGQYFSLHGPSIDGTSDMNSSFKIDKLLFDEALTDLLSV